MLVVFDNEENVYFEFVLSHFRFLELSFDRGAPKW